MIRDLADLEPLLRQYDPGKVLVGPLLNLADSSFRVFKIAGNGDKIYETIGLGFVKVEADAQRRRADIVAALQNRFGEVQIFDSQLEMARVAHTLWANDETSRFLATATAESKLRPARKVVQDQSLNDASKSSVLPSDRDKEFVDEAGRGSVAFDAASADAQPLARDQPQPTPACHPAQTDEPLNLPKVYASLPLDCDSPTFAVVGLTSPSDSIANTETAAETVANTEMAAETGANTETIAETDANTETATETDANTHAVFEYSDQIPVEKQSQNQPVSIGASAFGEDHALRQRGLRRDLVLLPTPPAAVPKWSIVERIITLCILILGVASVIVLLIEYEESIRDNVPSPPASLYSRSGVASMPLIASASDTPLTTHAAPIPEPQAAAPAPSNPVVLLDEDEIIRLIERGRNFLKEGDFPAARPLLKRAADAGSAEAALVLGSTYDPSVIKQLGAGSVTPDIDSALKWYAIAADRGSAKAADQYANLLRPPQTTGTVAAVVSEEPTAKPAEAARAQDRAPPASAPRTPPLQMSSTQAPTAPDDRASQPTKEQDAQADATRDSEPQDRSSQVPGVQVSTAPAAAMAETAHAEPSIAPTSEPKLPPPSAGSTDAPQPSSEVASRPALGLSATALQEASIGKQLKPAEVTALVSRGSDFLKTGDFSAARILLRRSAESGSADAALMLGKTFDPLFLRQIGAVGIEPDVAQCRHWYQKAMELGSEAAAQRLANLAHGR
jgi:TPR repeat protein